MEVHQINGRSYYIHVVEPGNTLYSISKKYNVPIDVIEKENASVNDGLSLGEKIFIPIKKDATREF
ncbi:MAG: LysM peptidoglycan-binding domain-containing protein, partial [Flavobacteriales bacterium]|nr:LysM peptidoglycan-binding domain-containing protein [Flavobacteriales bacterium]